MKQVATVHDVIPDYLSNNIDMSIRNRLTETTRAIRDNLKSLFMYDIQQLGFNKKTASTIWKNYNDLYFSWQPVNIKNELDIMDISEKSIRRILNENQINYKGIELGFPQDNRELHKGLTYLQIMRHYNFNDINHSILALPVWLLPLSAGAPITILDQGKMIGSLFPDSTQEIEAVYDLLEDYQRKKYHPKLDHTRILSDILNATKGWTKFKPKSSPKDIQLPFYTPMFKHHGKTLIEQLELPLDVDVKDTSTRTKKQKKAPFISKYYSTITQQQLFDMLKDDLDENTSDTLL